ncbi:hypothetical protein J3F84DRAFT_186415 [Trichoderma pleuroticola]
MWRVPLIFGALPYLYIDAHPLPTSVGKRIEAKHTCSHHRLPRYILCINTRIINVLFLNYSAAGTASRKPTCHLTSALFEIQKSPIFLFMRFSPIISLLDEGGTSSGVQTHAGCFKMP